MAFEIVEPGQLCGVDPLPEGMCSIAKSGKLTARQADLDRAGIGAYAIVLADRDTWRIGLRAVRDGEQAKSVAVTTLMTGKKTPHDTGRRSLNAARAVRSLDLEPEAIRGRYSLDLHGQGRQAVLILNLMEARNKTSKGAK